MFSWGREAPKAVFGAGLAGTILRVGLGINGGTQLCGELGTEVGDSSLDLPQEPMDLIIFLGLSWVSLVL